MEEYLSINRREFVEKFLKSSVALGLIASSYPSLGKTEVGTVKLVILHTNDTHSRIDPFPQNDSKYAGMGGYARRMELIRRIRSEEEHILLLDSGDIFQGTPYFNMYGGRLEFELMSKMGYDAATLGNHDFDNGIVGLINQYPYKSFPFLNSNYDFEKSELRDEVNRYKVFKKGGARIGVFGIGIELNGLVDERNFKGVIYRDPVQFANEVAEELKRKEKCDLIICLSHLGYRYENPNKVSDEKLARYTKNIDIILGGHTHTFLDEPTKKNNLDGKEVLIAQTGFGGIRLGRIDCTLGKNLKKYSAAAYTVKKTTKSS